MRIKELTTEKEWREAYKVMCQPRIHLDEAPYIDLAKEAVKVERYHLAALYEEGEIVALADLCGDLFSRVIHFLTSNHLCLKWRSV
ncbi:hypothetical protein [Oceanobacillus sojae]|uniref:hypothetical protein n=1 Tax=Oceanobacillus sojae TaxID=582851 RepID=UPI00098840F8|nr:hypothetical protein [Oceanobacillus sojae]MCT1902531.1 hypothetical protein [Oceanobacillus sojae]